MAGLIAGVFLLAFALMMYQGIKNAPMWDEDAGRWASEMEEDVQWWDNEEIAPAQQKGETNEQ